MVKNGVDAAAKTQGADVDYRSPDTFDMVQMAQLVDAAVASKPDGLVVSIPDADALGPSVQRATEGGIPVIVIDSGGAKLTRELGGLLYLGQSEYEAGVAAGERAAKLGVKKAACLNQEIGNTSLDDRCAGFAKGLGAEVPVVAGTIDPTEMKGRTSAYLRANPDTDFLLGMRHHRRRAGAGRARGAGCSSARSRSAPSISRPACCRRSSTARWSGASTPSSILMGYMPVVMLDLMHRYKLQPLADYPTGPGFVTKADAASVIELAKQGIR